MWMSPAEISACIYGYKEQLRAQVQTQQHLSAQAAIMYGQVWASYYAKMRRKGARRPITKVSQLLKMPSEDKSENENLPKTPKEYYELKEKLMKSYGIKKG